MLQGWVRNQEGDDCHVESSVAGMGELSKLHFKPETLAKGEETTMQNFYAQLFAQPQNQDSQILALFKITHLSSDKLRALAGDLIWGIWG